MAVMTFAAIDIGSYEVSMKIFEMSKRIGFRELNDVRYSLEIGKGVYSDGKIDSEMLNVLCEVLNDFKRLMQDFGVEEYRACGTSAFRELVNPLLIIEQIYQRTGMKIEILIGKSTLITGENQFTLKNLGKAITKIVLENIISQIASITN